VIELATFERAQRDVFDSPGSEGTAGLDARDLAAAPPDGWDQLRFTPVACLGLHRFEHAVHAYWAALKDGEQPTAPLPRATYLAICRQQYLVQRHELAPAEFTLLKRLIAGEPLNAAIARAAELPGIDWKSWEPLLGRWFARWMEAGFFTGLRPPAPR
jgi:hypothetical protein